MIEEAKKQADKIIRDAEDKSEMLVGETEVMKKASRKSEEIIMS